MERESRILQLLLAGVGGAGIGILAGYALAFYTVSAMDRLPAQSRLMTADARALIDGPAEPQIIDLSYDAVARSTDRGDEIYYRALLPYRLRPRSGVRPHPAVTPAP